jgi:hypothetical protein
MMKPEKKNQFHKKKSRKKNLSQLRLTWLTRYPRYEIKINIQKDK